MAATLSHAKTEDRKSDGKLARLENQILAWARLVVATLPRNLPLLKGELHILRLYLAQQRRLNLELDSQRPRRLPRLFFRRQPEEVARERLLILQRLQHRFHEHIHQEIEKFCQEQGLTVPEDLIGNWRVTIRYMAQQLHHLATQLKLGSYHGELTPRQQRQLSGLARELALAVVNKRELMLRLVPS